MDAQDLIRDRRSIRRFKPEKVLRSTLHQILDLTRWAPSWSNFQIARYTIIENKDVINKIASEGMLGVSYNINTLHTAPGLVVLSYVKGKSGKVSENEYATNKEGLWEIFDAGIACQTFCLSAFAMGVGTCVFGAIEDDKIANIISLPLGETVAALIAFGYPEGIPAPPARKSIEDITRFIEE